MRKFLLVFCASVACFLAAPRAAAQSQTTVTGNVVDPKGFFYAGGTVKPQLYPPGVAAPCVFVGPNCIPIPATVGPANIDFFGNFSVNVYPNALIFCNGAPCTTQWTFQICIAAPQAIIPQPIGTGDQCFSVTTTIAGASQNLTALITAAPPPNLTRIPIGGGCTPSGAINTGILSEHPVGSCFDSPDATWDDGASKQNLQFGDGTNFISNNNLSFLFGHGNHVTNAFEAWTRGDGNTVSANVADFTGFTFEDFFLDGVLNSATATGIVPGGVGGGSMVDMWVLGRGNNFAQTDTGKISETMCLMRGCAPTGFMAQTGGNVDDSLAAGVNWTIKATGSANTSSIYGIGEGGTVTSALSGNTQNSFVIGETAVLTSQAAGSSLNGVVSLGFNNTLHSTGGQAFGFAYQLGDHNLSQSTSAAMTETMQLGFNSSITNCSHVYFLGENGACSGVSNEIGIGLSATQEILVTPGKVNMPAVASVGTGRAITASGLTCTMAAGTTCTITVPTGSVNCVVSVQGATAIAGSCSVSGTTLTVHAASSNSAVWEAIVTQ